jgi:glycosyltransferase involved in cell wall biosynthesis
VNILLINHYAGSPTIGMEYRPYYLASEWQKLGHNAIIVVASHTHFRLKQFQLKQLFEQKNIDGVNYFILKTPAYEGHTIKRVINIIAFVLILFKYLKILVKEFKPDVVIASSTYCFDIFPAQRIAKMAGAKLVFEVHDLWPLSVVELGGYSKWHPFIMAMQIAENYAYKNSDKVISLLPNAIEYMKEHGLKQEKFVYVPNGINIEEWTLDREIPNDISNLIQKLKKQNKILIGYAGTLGLANALISLVDAMKILEKENINLLLIGKGIEKENLIQRTKELELKNVHFINSVPKTVIPALLDKLDILYIGLQKQPLFRFGISPNKLIDYMLAGKPIIQSIKAGNDMVSEAGCGISIEPENPIAIANAVRHLISLPIETLQEMGQKGKKYCIANHNYKVLAAKSLKAFQ